VREGDPGNALFVVRSGQVRVTKQDRRGQPVELAVLGPGAFFGEFALLSDRKRHATVTVSEDGVFFEISRKVIADLTKSDPAFGNTLRQFYRRRLLGTLVRSAPFFEPLSENEQEALMGRLRFRRIPEKTKIITEGEPGGGFFLILIGEVEVAKNQPDGSQKVLSRLADGSYFGEMSLLKGGNAVATVTTVTPTELVQLAAAEFYRILSKYPQIWEEVNREAKRRELANLQILSGRAPDSGPSDDSVVM
jgi:CRP-like cAMP-binding protein